MKLIYKNKQKPTTEPKGKPSSSTERSQRHQEWIYKRKDTHEFYKTKVIARQVARYVIRWNERLNGQELPKQNREKEHLKKQQTLSSQIKSKSSWRKS